MRKTSITFRLKPEEKDKLSLMALKEKKTLSRYLRDVLLSHVHDQSKTLKQYLNKII